MKLEVSDFAYKTIVARLKADYEELLSVKGVEEDRVQCLARRLEHKENYTSSSQLEYDQGMYETEWFDLKQTEVDLTDLRMALEDFLDEKEAIS